jgi:ribonucleoside-diphosphate reductase alpha chain
MYYLRSTAAADAIKFTLDKTAIQQPEQNEAAAIQPEQVQQVMEYDQKKSDMACSLDNPDACEACGS